MNERHQQKDLWERVYPIWHGVALLALVATTAAALNVETSPEQHAGLLALSGLLIPWYGLSLWTKTRTAHPLWLGLYYLLGWGMWFVLVLFNPMFYLLLFVLYPHPFQFVRMPLALGPIVGLTLAGVGREWLVRGELPGVSTVFLPVGLLVAVTIGGFVWLIIYESKQRQDIIDKLEATRAELAQAEREAGVRTERERMAHEIHDTLTQGFTSIIMYLEAARTGTDDPQYIDAALDVARGSLHEARRFVENRQPELLTDLPLTNALRQTVRGWSAQTGTAARFSATGDETQINDRVRHAVLRILQEALANVHQHAAADTVHVTLSQMPDRILLDVIDNGRGFAPSAAGEGGFGIGGMHKRAHDADGILTVESAPGDGTTITANLPIHEEKT